MATRYCTDFNPALRHSVPSHRPIATPRDRWHISQHCLMHTVEEQLVGTGKIRLSKVDPRIQFVVDRLEAQPAANA